MNFKPVHLAGYTVLAKMKSKDSHKLKCPIKTQSFENCIVLVCINWALRSFYTCVDMRCWLLSDCTRWMAINIGIELDLLKTSVYVAVQNNEFVHACQQQQHAFGFGKQKLWVSSAQRRNNVLFMSWHAIDVNERKRRFWCRIFSPGKCAHDRTAHLLHTHTHALPCHSIVRFRVMFRVFVISQSLKNYQVYNKMSAQSGREGDDDDNADDDVLSIHSKTQMQIQCKTIKADARAPQAKKIGSDIN